MFVSSLVGVIGAMLGFAARGDEPVIETRLVGLGAAGALAALDVFFVARRRISPVYLLDACLQAALVGGWMRAGSSS